MTMPDSPIHGAIDQSHIGRKDDHLYRVSVKGLIRDDTGRILVVKETGRTWWDLPGGGMDHGEDFKSALARELHEEVGLVGGFTYNIIAHDEPMYLEKANVMQIRLIFEVISDTLPTGAGADADEIAYLDPDFFATSDNPAERRNLTYIEQLSR